VDRVLMASIAATFGPLTNLAACASALLLSGPFLWAVAFGGEGGLSLRELWSKRNFRTPIFAFEAARVGLAGLSLVILAYRYLPNGYTLGLGLALVGIASILSTRYLGLVYGWFEERFLKNLEENPENKPSPAPAPAAALAPWDAHIAEFPVPAFGPFLGRTFQELGIRERFGVTVALIERGGRRMPAPGRDERVFPHDRLSVIGTDEQLAAFENFLRVEERRAEGENGLSDYSLEKLYLDGDSPLLGRTIRDSGLRESTHGLVVGIERDGKRMLNPDSQLSFRAGDHVWVVGDRRLIRALRESESK
jgi:CPA2 family monovalent cation:H+ antiporter-2